MVVGWLMLVVLLSLVWGLEDGHVPTSWSLLKYDWNQKAGNRTIFPNDRRCELPTILRTAVSCQERRIIFLRLRGLDVM